MDEITSLFDDLKNGFVNMFTKIAVTILSLIIILIVIIVLVLVIRAAIDKKRFNKNK